jgi:hypothetical protein
MGVQVVIGELDCPNCMATTRHEIHYVAGLLHRLDCLVCKQRWDVGHDRLRERYLRGLRERVSSKPGRLAREARERPLAFAIGIGLRVVSKPARLAGEAGAVVGVLDG